MLLTSPPEGEVNSEPMTPWVWNGTRWSEAAASGPAPAARSFFGAAFDADRDVVVLHGGQTTTGASAETWEWDGRSWARASGTGPGARSATSLTWDPRSGLSILYSGNGDDGTIPDDTWGWDGKSWSRLATTGPTPGRWPAATVAGSRQLLLYGGHQVADQRLPGALADTWSWNGRAWQRLARAGGPGPRVNSQGLQHPRLGELLVGGSDLERPTGDVWQWRVDRWELLARAAFPARQGFGLAYDGDRQRVVFTGGIVAPGSLERHQDVWEWSGDPNERARRVLSAP